MKKRTSGWQILTLAVLTAALVVPAGAQIIQEKFNTVTGTGGGSFFTGAGFKAIANWDNGLTGENAFAGTAGNAHITSASALGVTNAGVGNSGAGRIAVSGGSFNILEENFNTATGVGGVTFLTGTGAPDTSGYTLNWDDGLTGEGAFGGTRNGALLIGGMSAQGLTTGGASNSGAGQLAVSNVDITSGYWYGGLQWSTGPLPGATPLYNPGFESGGGSFANWTKFNNCYIDHATVRTGGSAIKMFGNWSGPWNASGVYQDMPATEGQVWRLDCWSRQNATDNIVGTINYVVMKMEFWSVAGQKITEQETRILDANSPVATWIDNPPLDVTAPAGTARVRAVIVFLQPTTSGSVGGAGYVDDVYCRPISGPNTVNLADYTLSAQVKGVANSGAGETLGEYQLRIEDMDGNRLLFRNTANGNWQTIGGALTSAIEADATGTPATGVFNVNSPSYTIVAAFDNEHTTPWGRGGTLQLDNLLMGNSNSAGSNWYAGLFWNNLVLPTTDPSRLFLSADVLGSKIGGNYALRIEGFRTGSAGLNESFDTVTGLGGGLFLDYTAYAAGARYGSVVNWDNGISAENAYAGLSGNAEIYYDGVTPYGFSAQGLPTGGTSGTGAGEIRVEGIIYSAGDGWYAGLTWPGQGLASTTLANVTLTADVKGTVASGGSLGKYELRIEDAQGDRLYFSGTANGSWQHVGGPLSTATFGPALTGNGNGVFNTDSASYTVVLAFADETASWQYGGALAIDNLFLTPAVTQQQLGTITFTNTSNGSFQSNGGLLNLAANTFPNDINESFDTVTGEGGGAFLIPGQGNSATNGWDTGIVRENAFAGIWGDANIIGDVSARGCTTCGVSGGGAGQLIVNNIVPNTGGWWAGVNWNDAKPDMRDPTQVLMSADIKATVNTAAGEHYGPVQLRIEDDGQDYLGFTIMTDGTWQHVGGALSTATVGSIDNGDGIFNYNADTYTLTIVFSGNATDWGTGGTVTIDNLFLSGIKLGDCDSYTVTLTFADEIPTWGTAGTLTLDNLVFTPAPNCNGDQDVDLADFARFQAAFAGNGTPPSGYECADLNGDGKVNLSDFGLIPLSMRGPR